MGPARPAPRRHGVPETKSRLRAHRPHCSHRAAPGAPARPLRAPPTASSHRGGTGGPRSAPVGSSGVPFRPRFHAGKSPCRRSGLSLCAIFFFSSPLCGFSLLLLLPEPPPSSLPRWGRAAIPGSSLLLAKGKAKFLAKIKPGAVFIAACLPPNPPHVPCSVPFRESLPSPKMKGDCNMLLFFKESAASILRSLVVLSSPFN